MKRGIELPRQIVVRLDEETYQELRSEAEANERNLSQEIRFRLRRLRKLERGDG